MKTNNVIAIVFASIIGFIAPMFLSAFSPTLAFYSLVLSIVILFVCLCIFDFRKYHNFVVVFPFYTSIGFSFMQCIIGGCFVLGKKYHNSAFGIMMLIVISVICAIVIGAIVTLRQQIKLLYQKLLIVLGFTLVFVSCLFQLNAVFDKVEPEVCQTEVVSSKKVEYVEKANKNSVNQADRHVKYYEVVLKDREGKEIKVQLDQMPMGKTYLIYHTGCLNIEWYAISTGNMFD